MGSVKQTNKLSVFMKSQSIRKQFAVTTIVLLAATILSCLLANVFFLERIYIREKKQDLMETYNLLNENTDIEKWTDEEFRSELEKACSLYNLKIIVLDYRNVEELYSVLDKTALRFKLIQYLIGYVPPREVLEENDMYMIQTTADTKNMEMWGWLDNGYTFLFTTPLESMEESAAISGEFMFWIGLTAIVLGGMIAWAYSGKISNPILELAKLSERITELDFEAKYIGNEKNEIGILGNNMNSLSNSLKQTISELKAANIELQQDIQKKEEIDKHRQEFIANVSHELKTPIALIQGYAEGLREGITDDPESMNYYLEVISDEAERMARMVKSLMALNELESGNQHIVMERFDLVALVRNYISNADILLKERECKLMIKSPEMLYVWGDEFKVEEVLMNYFSNAVNHVAGDQKEICITIQQIENKARVIVYNSGSCIPEEDLGRIWEKFYKVDKARTRAYGGSGVGLSIVKAIMNSLGQSYGVKNMPNGVAFWFELSLK